MTQKEFRNVVFGRFRNTEKGSATLTEREEELLNVAADVYQVAKDNGWIPEPEKNPTSSPVPPETSPK